MTLDDIKAMPVESIAADDALLWLWTTNAHLRVAFDVVDAWGFEYRTLLTWVKDLQTGGRISGAKAAWKRAAQAFRGFRFHDLRHQSITEMAEAGVPDAAMQSIAGHLSKKMLDHYSHVRMAAKRQAVETLGGGLIAPEIDPELMRRKAN
jgi:integrase